ncbi:cobalt ECF transporter T component CbiQ [Desulfocurvus sp. DL9XJH121]
MMDEPFTQGGSLLHRTDPRARLAAALVWSVTAALLTTASAAWAALILGGLLAGLSRPPLARLARRLAAVNVFILLLWALVPFSVPGDPVFQVLGFAATRQGFALALIVTLKSNAIVLGFIALVATIPVSDLGCALRGLRVPDKLAWLLVFTHRSVFVMAGEYQRMRQAMKIRGFTPRSNLHTYRALAYLAGMVLVRGLDRSERVHAAMLCRGFDGRFRSLNGLRATPRDFGFAACVFAACAALALYDLGFIA